MAVESRVARACTGFGRAFARTMTSACRFGLRLSGVCPRSSQLRIVWTLWHRRHQCISSQLRTACCACCALALSTRACGPCRRCGIECHHFGTGAVHASPTTIHFNRGRIIGHRCAHALPPQLQTVWGLTRARVRSTISKGPSSVQWVGDIGCARMGDGYGRV